MDEPLPRLDVRELAAIFAGGTLGALARVALAEGFPHARAAWPWTTFAVNVFGTFLLGFVVTCMSAASYRRPFLGIGVCGALTTFATLQLELLRMLDDDRWALALAYAGGSLAAGLLALRLGMVLARAWRAGA